MLVDSACPKEQSLGTYLDGLRNFLVIVSSVNPLTHFHHDHIASATVDKGAAIGEDRRCQKRAKDRRGREEEEGTRGLHKAQSGESLLILGIQFAQFLGLFLGAGLQLGLFLFAQFAEVLGVSGRPSEPRVRAQNAE